MTSIDMRTPSTRPSVTRLRRLIAAHPVTAFSIMAFGLGWPLLLIRTTTDFASVPVGYAYTYVALLGSALVVTWAGGGRQAVGRFLARYLIWRLGARRWVLVVLALPALTVAVAAASGTLHVPGHGWAYVAGLFLYNTFITGALEVNLAEEGGWSGLVQTRFAARHGLLRGALCTSPLFVAVHVPLQFSHGWTWGGVATGVVVLAVIAPFFRYVIGETLEATGGSLLAVGILHASFNASGSLGFPGGWQFLPALVLLSLGIAVTRRVRRWRGAAE
jgi:membrane protease YdiL (CAAX protease family)